MKTTTDAHGDALRDALRKKIADYGASLDALIRPLLPESEKWEHETDAGLRSMVSWKRTLKPGSWDGASVTVSVGHDAAWGHFSQGGRIELLAILVSIECRPWGAFRTKTRRIDVTKYGKGKKTVRPLDDVTEVVIEHIGKHVSAAVESVQMVLEEQQSDAHAQADAERQWNSAGFVGRVVNSEDDVTVTMTHRQFASMVAYGRKAKDNALHVVGVKR